MVPLRGDLHGGDHDSTPVEVTVVAPAPGATEWTPTAECGTVLLSVENAQPSGISYQWQSSPDDTFASPTDLGTAATQSVSPGTTTWYRCVVTCDLSGSTTNSTPLELAPVAPIPGAALSSAPS